LLFLFESPKVLLEVEREKKFKKLAEKTEIKKEK